MVTSDPTQVNITNQSIKLINLTFYRRLNFFFKSFINPISIFKIGFVTLIIPTTHKFN